MPRGAVGETVASRGPVDVLVPAAQKCKSRVVASKSPKRWKGYPLHFKVRNDI